MIRPRPRVKLLEKIKAHLEESRIGKNILEGTEDEEEEEWLKSLQSSDL